MTQRVSLGDIEQKLREIGGGAQSTVSAATEKPPAIAIGTVIAVALVTAIYILGRRRGRKEAPILEIRRI